MNTMTNGLAVSSVTPYVGTLLCSSAHLGARVVAPVAVPSTGAVRPQADIAFTTPRLVDGKGSAPVRSWSPPV